MVLNLITFASLLHKQASILGSHELILNELEKYFTVNIVEYQNINKLTKDDFSLLFIATGGVERLVIQHFESLPRPVILLADGMQNSLAACPRNFVLVTWPGYEKRNSARRATRNHQAYLCTIQQLQSSTSTLRIAYRRNRCSFFLARFQQCRLPPLQTTLGN